MPNNFNARRAGSILPAASVSSNKIVRGQVLTAKLSASAQPTQTPAATVPTPGTGPGTGTVTSITAGRGLVGTSSPITVTGTIAVRQDVFNVKDYNAVGDGSTDDTANIGNAITAAVAAGGTVYFPPGKYKLTSGLSAATTVGKNVSFVGNSAADTFLYQTTAGANGLTIDLSSSTVQCYTEVTGLSFISAPTVATGTALTITYGNTNIASTSHFPGPWVHHCSFGQKLSNDTGGWVNGITAINCWLAKFETLFSLGNFATYASASSPGAGDGGPGSGYFIGCFSGTNFTIRDIHAHAWGQAVRLAPVSVSTAGQTQIAQGVLMADINVVEAWEAFHFYSNNAHDEYDFVTLSNFQVDNGNFSVATHRCIYAEYMTNFFLQNGLCLQRNGLAIVEISGSGSAIFINNVAFSTSVTPPSAALVSSGTTNFAQVIGCNFNNLPITLSAGSGWWTIENTFGSTVSNSGTSNKIGDARQFEAVITPTATATYAFSTSIALCGLAALPRQVDCDVVTSLPNDYAVRYDFANGGNTATTAFFLLFRYGGGALAASAIRIGFTVNP